MKNMFEQFSQPLKVALSVLCVVLFAVLTLVILGENGLLSKKASAPEPSAITSQSQPQTAPSVPPTEVRRVLGTVEQISGQEITLKDFRKISSIVSTTSGQSDRIVVGVDQSTLIERLTHKDAAVFSAELDAFYKNIQKAPAQNPSTSPASPVPFTLEKITIGDIKVGDSITASFAEDIANLTTFTATKIEIQN